MIGSRPLALALFLLLAPAGCSDSDPGPVHVRLRNASPVVMEDVVVGFPEDVGRGGDPVEPGIAESGDVDYGTVQPGETTPYRAIARAYRFAPVTLTVDGRVHRLQPDDYVGEALLDGGGRYTYELDFDGGTLLGIRLVRD